MDELSNIKLAILRALMKDEILMYGLVLKGGNALSLAYDITDRGSIDIDFSMEKDFTTEEYTRINNQLKHLLESELVKVGYFPIDINFREKPKSGEVKEWKGYQIEFKLVDIEFHKNNKDNMDALRRNALKLYDNNSTIYTVDISAYEYVEKAIKKEIDGVLLRVYTPSMLIVEKIRAMCQSMKRYQEIIPTAREKKRARDLFDIFKLYESFSGNIDINSELVENVFKAKKVPLHFLKDFESLRDSYRLDWETVISTIHEHLNKDFDFYFDFVLDKIRNIIVLLENKDSIHQNNP